MDESPDENPKHSLIVCLGLMLGLAPIPLFLLVAQHQGPLPSWINFQVLLFFCFTCNVAGGVICLRHMKNPVARFLAGVCLGVLFLIICGVIGIFVACSNMNI